MAEGVQEDRFWRILQMSTARGRDEGRTRIGSVKGRTRIGSVKGVIASDRDPGMAEPDDDDDPDGDYF